MISRVLNHWYDRECANNTTCNKSKNLSEIVTGYHKLMFTEKISLYFSYTSMEPVPSTGNYCHFFNSYFSFLFIYNFC